MSYEMVNEMLADPPIERECGSREHFLWNVRQWAMMLAMEANLYVTPSAETANTATEGITNENA